MRAKKYLKKLAETEQQEILEARNMQIYEAMLKQVENNSQPKQNFFKRYAKWLMGAAGVLVSTIILVCVLVFYPSKEDTFTYLEQNFIESDSTIEEMDTDMKEFDFEINTLNNSVKIKKTTDSVTGDTIFYKTSVILQNSLIRFEFVAVCNRNYRYPNFNLPNNFEYVELTNYSICYKEKRITDTSLGVDKMTCLAQIQKGTEYIYITEYTEYLQDEEGSFLKIIQEIFI